MLKQLVLALLICFVEWKKKGANQTNKKKKKKLAQTRENKAEMALLNDGRSKQ